MVKSFKIEELFGNLNVNLNLSSGENIYIGENGIGKTTILSTIFNTLSRKWMELSKIEFKFIEIELNDSSYKFSQEDLKIYVESKSNRRHAGISSILESRFENDMLELLPLYNQIENEDVFFKEDVAQNLLNTVHDDIRVPKGILKRHIVDFFEKQSEGTLTLRKLDEKLIDFTSRNEILYFPTFRRIEEDLSKLIAFSAEDKKTFSAEEILPFPEDGSRNHLKYDGLIKFGMTDVDSIIKSLLDEIKKKSISSFNQMTAILLTQYVSDDFNSEELKSTKFDINNLKISLDRVGSEIDIENKEKIIELVRNQQIYDAENKYLLNFMKNLLESHEPLRRIDKKIEDFITVCNNYLVNKKYVYDASEVTLEIVNNIDGRPIPLTKLSSGEKQIISTFSKVYLEFKKDYIILFDEPELSLSIDWQQRFIPDIMSSTHCKQLVCVTHSPFIFENDRLFDLSKEILSEIQFASLSE